MDRSWMPTTSGILSIICGAVDVFMGFAILVGGSFFTAFMPMMNDFGSGTAAFGIVLALVGVVIIVVGAVAIVGGVYALRKKMWGMALAGAIAAFFSWTSILGIASIVIIAMSRDQFNKL